MFGGIRTADPWKRIQALCQLSHPNKLGLHFQIVFTPTEKKEDEVLTKFIAQLEADDVIVRTVATGSMDCVLKSQLIRLFAFQLVDHSEDLVNLFVVLSSGSTIWVL